MTELDPNDDTWEDFFGTTTTDLMPSIMGAFDVFIETTRSSTTSSSQQMDGEPRSSNAPKKTFQAGNFSNLSPCVQKILSNVPDEELTKHFASEEILSGPKRTGNRPTYRSLRSPDRRNSTYRTRPSPEKQHNHHHPSLNKSSESLNIISPNVQKMLSNFPDAELILGPGDLKNRNHSFLHQAKNEVLTSKYSNGNVDLNVDGRGEDGNHKSGERDRRLSAVETDTTCDATAAADEDYNKSGDDDVGDGCCSYSPKPLGSYLHTSPHGIASRTPIGRKNVGKFLQVPSECSVGTSSTASSEVSRPVSLTSLGSCSSSSSSGPNQPCSAYLASAESLDSDPESNDRQGSADSGIAEQVTVSTQQRVLQEVLETETVYVSDLNEVIQGYLEPWRKDENCPLAQHISSLFSNIVEIHSFNKSFLEQLQEADFDPTKTANVFIQNVHGFTVYNEYCTNYPRTMEILGELTRDDNMISVFREKQVALGHALPLGSYLLKPVQRILKYHLLLLRLSKQCEPAHKPAVDLALTTMTSIATSINSMKRKHEHTVRVHEIQSLLCDWPGPDLTTQGELIAEGTFRMNGARGRRHVVLFDKILLIAKKKQDGSMVYKLHIKCSNLMLVEQVRKEPLSFQILPFDNPRLQCTLRARSPQHKREWTLMIKRAILENYNAVIPNHARQLVMQLGQDLHETEEDSNDKWLTLNKQSTPHYLERRTRTRKSRTLANKRGDQSFPSLGSWRRKSEPAMAMIHQYNTKTVPKKISKLKKAKEGGANATFYTDLSDSENCDAIGESNESLAKSVDVPDNGNNNQEVEKNLEKIVSDLLMQNGEFHKVMNRPRKSRVSEPEASVWLENRDRTQEVSKADSLPRSFQLNDQVKDSEKHQREDSVLDESLKEDCLEDGQYENDLSSQLDDNEYPVHKIYRKTAIRFSLVQRIRALVSEEHRGTHKCPAVHKQGSEAMGEKIAHPDYVDPQKLFSSSRSSLAWEDTDEPKRPDMTISEKEVLNEFEKRLSLNNNTKSTSQNFLSNGSSHHNGHKLDEEAETTTATTVISSSQNSDSYYESVLDTKLVEEYTKDESGKLVVKQDSFRNSESVVCVQKFRKSEDGTLKLPERRNLKRPTKAPPPIPIKPTHLLNNKLNEKTINGNTRNQNQESIINNNNNERGTSWVKAMVGRFE